MDSVLDLIKQRRSVRTFDGKGLSEEMLKNLKEEAEEISELHHTPFDVPVRFVFLDAKKEGLSSPVIGGESFYVAGIVAKEPHAEVNFGYAMEELLLWAQAQGLGSTWIGGTMKREAFEKAAGLGEGEMMPCVSPLGVPAEKMSVKEALMRKGVKADSRFPASKLFFDETYGNPVDVTDDGDMADILEMVRWAPSAVNKQPWRLIRKGDTWHFYEKKDRGYVNDSTGDLQKIDVGIALYHFVLGAEERCYQIFWEQKDPGIAVPEDVEYITSVKLESFMP